MELQQKYAPGHHVSHDQGLGLTAKALAKTDEMLATKARLTTIFLPVTLTSSSVWSFFTNKGVSSSLVHGGSHRTTPSQRVYNLPASTKTPRDRRTKLPRLVHCKNQCTRQQHLALSQSRPNLVLNTF